MPNLAFTLLALAAQGMPGPPGFSTPPGGDTTGYWQQRVHYEITATLDERAQRVRARGTLRYVNNSPDTLRELYFHQYLNAFRPGSKWSEVDGREGRVRFQFLEEPDFAYERFTGPVTVNGVPVAVAYPGAPDSTVVRLSLPSPLGPRDSLSVAFEWDARPSTIPRRQARRGRHWDLAQWYPKVAVYDRGGWQANALQPAGEFYGEFGTYDVTLIVPNDQVLAATGVPIAGDPGWARVIRSGISRTAANAYGELPPSAAVAPPGLRSVRLYARDVHHFAWTASPDYRYEGAAYARPLSGTTVPAWDTVSVHVLYRSGDDTTWGGQRALRRAIAALQWLEAIYGPYPYPQLTAHHRLDGGGGETPMMMMNGSPSQGLILHEGGHMYTYGALANNEWRSGWIDEGLTSYQTAWAQFLTPTERVRAGIAERPLSRAGYRGKAIRMPLPRYEIVSANQTNLDLMRRAQPMGTTAHEFRDFDTYNDMIYDRAEVMFSQLRELLGDSVFVGILHDFYGRWALKHVDEHALRASAERVSGRNLRWFFDQWVRRTGVMDYRLRRARWSRASSGGWVTEATVERRGEFAHPMPVGVRTSAGWTLGRMSELPYESETLRITTQDEPLEVRLDPFHVTWDWDRRNDVTRRRARNAVDWPFLSQADRERSLSLWRPMAWYSRPGGANIGLRQRGHYLGWLDQGESGFSVPTRDAAIMQEHAQGWARVENPYFPFLTRPAVGWRAGVARLDDVIKADIGRRRERNGAGHARVNDVSLTYTVTQGQEFLPEAWVGNASGWSADVSMRSRFQWGPPEASYSFVESRLVAGGCGGCTYGKLEGSAGVVSAFSENARLSLRAFAGAASHRSIPGHRRLFLSAEDPVSTFENHWWRPREAILKQPNVNWLPLGGGALRGYHWNISASNFVAANIELSRRVGETRGDFGALQFWLSAFGDAGYINKDDQLVDAGLGMNVRGQVFDQPVTVRFDFPAYVSRPALAIDRDPRRLDRFAPRWVITFNDIW